MVPAGGRYPRTVGRWPLAAAGGSYPRAVGRWPVAVNRGPVAADRGQRWPDRDGPDAQPVAVIRRTSRPDRGPRIVNRAHRIGSTGQRIAHPGKRARGPGLSGQTAGCGFSTRGKRSQARALGTAARAMFLANIYLFFRIGFNCLIFAVKIAYITCYVPRETSKTAYQKLARDPYECSKQPGVRREKTEA